MDRQLGILSHSEIRAKAREYLKGYWLKLFIITLVATVITGFFGLASLDIKFVTGKLWTDAPSIVVTHVSGYSWTGKAPVEADEPKEVPAYSLSDLIAGADEKQDFNLLSLCRYLPSGFWAVFAVSAVCSIHTPGVSIHTPVFSLNPHSSIIQNPRSYRNSESCPFSAAQKSTEADSAPCLNIP